MDRRNRIIIGLLLGAGMGLTYGLVSQAINLVALRGIPLYDPPPGRLVHILVSTLAGAGVGLLASWPQEGLVGVFLGSLGGALAVSLQGVWKAAGDGALLVSLLVMIYTFIPRLFYFLPLAAAVRWGIGRWENSGEDGRGWLWQKARLPIGLLLAAMLVGSLALYPSQVRAALRAMDRMLGEALEANNRASLPDALKVVEGFPYGARGFYTLEWSEATDLFQGPRPVTSEAYQDALIIVRFENGFVLQCLYTLPLARPLCSSRPTLRVPMLRHGEHFSLAGIPASSWRA